MIKIYLAILAAVITLGTIAVGTWGIPKVFCTVEKHKIDFNSATKEIAANTQNIQMNTIQARVYWLQQWIAEVEEKYGTNPDHMPSRIGKDYKKYVKELDAHEKWLLDVGKKITK